MKVIHIKLCFVIPPNVPEVYHDVCVCVYTNTNMHILHCEKDNVI